LTTVKLSELAKAYNKDLATLKPVFLAMMQKGYFEYDPEVETIKLSRKELITYRFKIPNETMITY
jgi:hypothetical protein